jgi:hypothetical protein
MSFGRPTLCSILCGIQQKKNIRESARERGKDWERNEDTDSPVVLDFEWEWPLVPAAPTRNSTGLGRFESRSRGGKWRGGCDAICRHDERSKQAGIKEY